MTARISNYYASANSAQGFVSFFEENVVGIDNFYILKGGSGEFKSALMKRVGINWYLKGNDVEYIHCASDEIEVEAVLIPALKLAVVDGDLEYIAQSRACGTSGEIVSLDPPNAYRAPQPEESIVSQLRGKIQEYYKKAYEQLQKALSIHDEWEKIYSNGVDFSKLDLIADSAIKKFLSDMNLKKEGIIKNRFFGSLTYKGSLDFVADLTRNLGKRYFIKGRPGSGKSTLLGKIADAAHEKGFDVEIYRCVLDPGSIDMVIVRELDFAVFDSTYPHEYSPVGANDEVIDLYQLAIAPGTDEKYREDLGSIISSYKDAISLGVSFFSKAKELEDQIKAIIGQKINQEEIDKIYKALIQKLNAL